MKLRFPRVAAQDDIDLTTIDVYGDDIWSPVLQGHERFAFQNVHTMERWPNPAGDEIRTIREYNLSVFGVAEPNCEWNSDMEVAVNANMRRELGKGFIAPASLKRNDNSNSGYLPGGVMQMITGDVTGRHMQRGQDKYGRYSWFTLRGKNDNRLCVITAYRVCHTNLNDPQQDNSNKSYWQQVRALVKDGFVNPNLRQQILTDLTKFITKMKDDGFDVLLMIDANETIDDKDGKWKNFLRDNLLDDVHDSLGHPKARTTRYGSPDIIDYMVGTSGIVSFARRGGYRPLNESIISDHVLLWAEFDLRSYFGGDGPAIPLPQAREFSVDNEPMRTKFLDELRRLHEHQRIPDRITKLDLELKLTGATPSLVRRYNAIDRDIVRSIKGAARVAVKKKQYGYHRSPALIEAGNDVLFWKSVLSSKRKNIPLPIDAPSIANRSADTLDAAECLTLSETDKMLRQAWATLKATQKNAKELRMKWLESIARVKAASNEPEEVQKQLKTMIRNLHDKQMHRKLTAITKGTHRSLGYIEVPTSEWYYSAEDDEIYHYDNGVFETHVRTDDKVDGPKRFYTHHTLKVINDDAVEATVNLINPSDGSRSYYELTDTSSPTTWRRISDRHEIESTIMNRNKRHLQQMAMEDSPPSTSSFESLLSNYGDTPLANKILEDEVTDELDSFPRVIRTWLQQFRRTPTERTKCQDITGFIDRFAFQQAFHEVHEKTSSSPLGIHYTFWKCIAMDNKISEYMVIMMRLPFMYAFVNDRWARCIDVMLEKRAGVCKIHLLRIIGLVEADFNTALKIYFAKQLIANSERTELTEEQWGGRPGGTATQPALRKMLAFEYGRALFVTIALFANDAVANFDRMVPNISTLVARKYGTHQTVMTSRNMTMERMQHAVRTQHGDSSTTYQQEVNDVPLAGETQGKGDVASIWSLESHTILRAHRQLHEGIRLPSVNLKRVIDKNNDAFVDDCDGVALKLKNTYYASEESTREHLGKGAELWARIIEATGGAIAFHKCFWQMLAFSDATYPPTVKDIPNGEIYLRDAHGGKTRIKKLDSKTPNKGLGCRQAADGNMDAEFEHREGQCRELAARALEARLDLHESYCMLLSRIVPRVTYSMPLTSFDVQQCRKLNTIIDRVMLNKLGLNRNMPKAVVYSPFHMGGLNYPSFQIIQDQKGVLNLLKELRWNKTIANDILTVLSVIQLCSGLTDPIMEDVSTNLSYLGNSWFLHIRDRLRSFGGTLWIEHQWTPTLQRMGDLSLMGAFTKIPGITMSILWKANFCRWWMGVTTLAELANTKGTRIPGNRLNGKWRSSTTFIFPHITKPPAQWWYWLRWCMRRTFVTHHRPSRLHQYIILDQPLGPWIPTERYHLYDCYRTATTAYTRTDDSYQRYTRDDDSNVFSRDIIVHELPPDSHPIDARINATSLWTSEEYSLVRNPVSSRSPSFTTAQPHPRPNLAGSDGSVDVVSGDRACAYSIHYNGVKYSGRTRFPPSHYSTSYRSELEGMYGALNIARDVQPIGMLQTCDNRAAVDNVSNPILSSAECLKPEADIIEWT